VRKGPSRPGTLPPTRGKLGRLGKSGLWAAYAVLALLLAAPLLVAEVPLGMDTVNHLARIHVRAHIAGDADLAGLFGLRDGLVPYMGLDWLLTPLAKVMPTLVAGRVGIVLILWGTVGAVVVLQRVFTGRIGAEPLLMGLVSYNSLLASGFLTYLVGVVGALLGLAAWHGLRDRPWLARLGAAAAVATALYLTHLLALALYGVMLGAYEVFGRPRAWRTPVREWALLGMQVLPSALLWLSMIPPQPPERTSARWLLETKVLALVSPVDFAGRGNGIALTFAILAGCTASAVILTRRGVLAWDRKLAAPAIVLLLMGLVAPTWALGVYLVDLRFPAPGVFLGIAALTVLPAAAPRLLPLGLVLAVAFVLQVWSAGAAMHACDHQYGELRAAMQALPQGTVLTTVLETEEPAPEAACTDLPIFEHIAQLVTVERSGYSPDFFSRLTSVTVRPGLDTDAHAIRTHQLTPDMLPRQGRILWLHMGNHSRPVPPGMVLLHAGSFFDLYSIP